MKKENSKIASGLAWKLLERFGVLGGQFLLQVILARILDPEHYGTLSLMVIFTTLANVFIQRGLNMALIQNKDVTDEDYSSVLWISLAMSAVLYGVLFAAAPAIAAFYEIPKLVQPFRVLCLMLIPGAVNSVQIAKVSREMNFKKVFYSNIGGIVVSGAVGIALAKMGGGLWALVAQSLLNVVVVCIVMAFTVKLPIRFVCHMARVKVLFSYGWKLLVSGLLETLYQDIHSLVVGKKYSASMLGHYDRGKQFPQFLINGINSAVQSVLLPAMSAQQDDRSRVKNLMRGSVTVSAYVIFPMMAGLAGVARPLVQLLLTDKWLSCVPFLQISCFTFAFYPVHTSNLQAINAMGRSDIFLKLEIIKKALGMAALAVAVIFFDSPLAIAMTGAITTVISCFINAAPNRKLIDYAYAEQMKDILPSFAASLVMLAGVLAVLLLPLGPVVMLLTQLAVGVGLYLGISVLFRPEPFVMLLGMVRKYRKN